MFENILNFLFEKPKEFLLAPKNTKVLFICKKRITSYGYLTSSGLLNSARMVVEELIKHGIQCKLVDVIDGDFIDREIYAYKPTHVVLEAFWCPPYKLEELMKLYPKIKWTVRNHSKICFLSGEGIAFKWAYDYQNIKNSSNYTLSSNSIEAVKDLHALHLRCAYTPNIYNEKVYNPSPWLAKNEIHIGCFGAIRLLKNNVIQAIAAIKFAEKHKKKLFFHINASRNEMQGEPVLKGLRAIFENTYHVLVEHDWLSHEDFMKVARTIDLGLQVSYTETFNIVAADLVYAGVPTVVSPEIDWMPILTHANPNDMDSIVNCLERLYQRNKNTLQYECIKNIKEYNKRSVNAWIEYLTK